MYGVSFQVKESQSGPVTSGLGGTAGPPRDPGMMQFIPYGGVIRY